MKQTKRKEEVAPIEALKDFLRETGRMFPATPEQVEAFESRLPKKVKLPDLLSDPVAMLRRGFLPPLTETTKSINESTQLTRMAARQAVNLSAEVLRKMDTDRRKIENQE